MDHSIKIRTSFVFFIFIVLYGLLIFNLYIVQIKQQSFFSSLAERQYNVSLEISPPRGLIYDRTGTRPLAINKEIYSAFLVPKSMETAEHTLMFLQKNFPHAAERFEKNTEPNFFYIKRRLSDAEKKLIEDSNISDIKIVKEAGRFYPCPFVGTIVGMTNIDNVGITGIELLFNDKLSGSPEKVSLEKDARSNQFYFKKSTKEEGISSLPIKLTIDSDLQFLAVEEAKECLEKFGFKEVSAVIINPDNGEILALVSLPDFDPNDISNVDVESIKNRTISNVYELGSVMKVFVSLAALEEGVIRPDDIIDCGGSKNVKIDGINLSTTIALGKATFAEVVQNSNNIGMAFVGKKLGEKLYDHYTRVGFGEKTNIPLPGEQSGFVNPPNNWSKRSPVSLSFGYEITGSLLQLAKAFCIVANGGYKVHPKLILTENPVENKKEKLYSDQSISEIRDILEKTILQGTAVKAKINGYKVMGKTGTANMVVNGKYDVTKNRYAFCGIVEKGDYRRVIVTFAKEPEVKQKLFAANTVAPLFEKIAEKLLIHDRVI
ncbi:MAG: Peptidoglycan transglycosylase and transpeptidase FtsI [candidate division TM6 bacterium GW2011_GWF2_32_72]|nr:MAG: Peptidoglycan transglycosylase and transpeptidase FtsI [candidate division TM6 bacterium GW2011_GWF2_32_72]